MGGAGGQGREKLEVRETGAEGRQQEKKVRELDGRGQSPEEVGEAGAWWR